MPYVEDLLPELYEKEPKSFVTCIDNRVQVKEIANLSRLPKPLISEIKSTLVIRSYGFQELVGYNSTNTIMFSCGGYWEERHDMFVVTSYGSHNYQWDGDKLRNTIKEYV